MAKISNTEARYIKPNVKAKVKEQKREKTDSQL